MNRNDYTAQVDALRAPDALRARIAALPRKSAPKSVRWGRRLSLAACLILAVGLAVSVPALLRQLRPGGELKPPVVAQPTDSPRPSQAAFPAVQAGGSPLTVYEGSDAPEGVEPELIQLPVGAMIQITGPGDGPVSSLETRYLLDTGEAQVMGGGTGPGSGSGIQFEFRLSDKYLGPTRYVLSYTYDDGTVREFCFFYRCVPEGAAAGELDAGFAGYAAPVLPLMEDGHSGQFPGLTVDRQITFDLSDRYPGEQGYGDTAPIPKVTDRYVLHNGTGEDKNLILYYPWAGSLELYGPDFLPTVAVDGKPRTVLNEDSPQPIPGKSTAVTGDGMLNSWADYQALLRDGTYLTASLFPPEIGLERVPVTIYEIRNIRGYEGNPAILDPWSATLALECTLSDPDAQVFTYGFNGYTPISEDALRRQYSFFLNDNRAGLQRIIVVGGALEDCTITGYQDGTCAPDKVIPSLTGMLSEVLPSASEREGLGGALYDCVADSYYGPDPERPLYAAGYLYRALCDLVIRDCRGPGLAESLSMEPGISDRYTNWTRVEELIGDAAGMTRVFFFHFGVTVPAGESAVVESSYYYSPSASNIGLDGGETPVTYGFDLAASLGSSLDVSSLTLALVPAGEWAIVSQNIGFDLDRGVTQAATDPEAGRYYFALEKPS